MNIFDKFLNYINGAELASVAYKPTTSYSGGLPSGTVKKGSKGSDAKKVQLFLNWCIKAGLAVDSYCGSKTVAAIKKYQKQYGLKVDGVFGNQSKKKAKEIVNKYAPKTEPVVQPPATTTTPEPEPPKEQTWADKAVAWAKSIANDNSWHYVKWAQKVTATHECPICKNHPKGAYHGWNCIGFAYSCLYHGAGIKIKHNNGVINNAKAEKILAAKTDSDATKIVQDALGNKDFKCIKRKAGFSQDLMKPGDICLYFKDAKTYQHTFIYIGNGRMIDCTSVKNTANQIMERKALKPKVIIRYTGK